MLTAKTIQLPTDLISQIASEGISSRRAVNHLYETFSYMIRNGQQKFNLSESDAFSAYNQALTSLVAAIRTGTFRGDSSLKTYLYRAFKNQCINLVTQMRRSTNTMVDIEDNVCPDCSPDCIRQLIAEENLNYLFACLDKLNSKARAILMGAADEGLSSKQIAEKNGIKNAATVDVLKRRYRKQLKQMMKEAA